MNIKYLAVQTESVEDASQFFQTNLGYQPAGEIELWPEVRCKLFSGNDDSPSVLLIPDGSPIKDKNVIILSTDHCLKDYHEMKNRGINFITPPAYQPSGLVAEFEDDAGNHYILLEQRMYEEI